MKKVFLALILILCITRVESQSNMYLKVTCELCNGKKTELGNVACPNCYYWTESQRQYNYCSVCKNRKYIDKIVSCTRCEGKGYGLILNVTKNLDFIPYIYSPNDIKYIDRTFALGPLAGRTEGRIRAKNFSRFSCPNDLTVRMIC